MRAENRTLGENGRGESGESQGESDESRGESGKSRGQSGGESGAGYLTLMCIQGSQDRRVGRESGRVGQASGESRGESGRVGQSWGRVGGEPLRIGGAAAARADDLNVSVLLAGSTRQSHSRQ